MHAHPPSEKEAQAIILGMHPAAAFVRSWLHTDYLVETGRRDDHG